MDNSGLALDSDSYEQVALEYVDNQKSYEHHVLMEFAFELQAQADCPNNYFEVHQLHRRPGESVAFLQQAAKNHLEGRARAAVQRLSQYRNYNIKYLLIQEQSQELLAHEIFINDDNVTFSTSYIVLLDKYCNQTALFLFSGSIIAADCTILRTNGQNCVAVSRVYMQPTVIQPLRYGGVSKVVIVRTLVLERAKLYQLIQTHYPAVVVLFVYQNLDSALRYANYLSAYYGFRLIFAPCEGSNDATPEFPNVYATKDGGVYYNPAQFTVNGAGFLAIEYPFNYLRQRFLYRTARVEGAPEHKASTQSTASKITIKSTVYPRDEEAPREQDELQELLDIRISASGPKEPFELQQEMINRGFDEYRMLSFVLSLVQEHEFPFLPPLMPVDYTYDFSLRYFSFVLLYAEFALPLYRLGDLFIVGCGMLSGSQASYGVVELDGASVKCYILSLN